MRARPIRVYLDSNVLIAYVADEEGRAGVVQSVLEDARGKKSEVARIWGATRALVHLRRMVEGGADPLLAIEGMLMTEEKKADVLGMGTKVGDLVDEELGSPAGEPPEGRVERLVVE